MLVVTSGDGNAWEPFGGGRTKEAARPPVASRLARRLFTAGVLSVCAAEEGCFLNGCFVNPLLLAFS